MAAMEDVLDLYAEPYDPQRPVVCFDETSTQLLADVREPLPAKPGRPRREDYEYQRGGTRNLFLTCEPRRGWRHVAITRQRTMQDFAQQMRWLVDEAYPDVPVIRLVLDNLNTHRMASLYETFPAAEARRIAKRLEFHHTPKHGSWLNMAEIEFSVLARACLRGRNGDEDSLERAVSACVSERNAIGATINWRFTAQDARRKQCRIRVRHGGRAGGLSKTMRSWCAWTNPRCRRPVGPSRRGPGQPWPTITRTSAGWRAASVGTVARKLMRCALGEEVTYGGIAIRRRCARALDSVAAVGGSWNDKKSAAMDAGSEAYMAGQPCFPPTENLEDRQLN